MNTLQLEEHQITAAANFLKNGQVLGLPTETVYGLAANGLSEEAVSGIFKAKGRPEDNPLILHVASASWIPRYCSHVPDSAWKLAEHFFPGPLTLILERNEIVPDIVTAGLSTVGIRCPDHPVARAVIEQCGFPLAAPSGNTSGKPSPTSLQSMLEDMNGKIPAIIQGGSCLVGVESTIIDVRTTPKLLRAGGISVEELETVLGQPIEMDPSLHGVVKATPLAPGMKYRHYAPDAPVTVVVGKDSAHFIAKHVVSGDGVICFQEYETLFSQCLIKVLGKEDDFLSHSKNIFSALRFFNTTSVPRIWAQCPKEEGLGLAVSNRLRKAAGFQVIDSQEELP